jgi:gas vesicle protein
LGTATELLPGKHRKKSANPQGTARIRQIEFQDEIEVERNLMRTGNYEASDSGSAAGTAVTFLLIGLGAGTLLGMLLAPKAGKQMRTDLRKRFDTARETVDEWTEDAREFAEDAMERGAEIADQVKERVAPLAKAMRR